MAYNRFYPPELATVEARNASPDRSHNETFDALVITGGIGFLVWQALYLSVFYYGFSWLGVVRSNRDRNILIAFWIIGAIVLGTLVVLWQGLPFIGVGIPFGSIAGLVLYLVYYALFVHSDAEEGEEDKVDPFSTKRLLMLGLVTAVLAHYVEIHFGIAIAATRTHFFMFIALMFLSGYLLPSLKEKAVVATTLPTRKGRRVRQVEKTTAPSSGTAWWPIWLVALMLGLTIGILAFEFVTYVLPPDKNITSASDITATEIFHQSYFINTRKDFSDEPFIFVMLILTWSLGVLVYLSEMVKNGELNIRTYQTKPLETAKRRLGMAIFALMSVIGFGAEIVPLLQNFVEAPIFTAILIALFLAWIGLCVWFIVSQSTLLDTPLYQLVISLGTLLLIAGQVGLLVLLRNESNATALLGGTLLLLWSALSAWVLLRLHLNMDTARFIAGAVATTGVLFALPTLVSGNISYALLIGGICAFVLSQFWDNSWQNSLLPAGVLGATSLTIGLLFGLIQATVFRASLFAPDAAAAGVTPIEGRVLEALQVTSFLTLLYFFVGALLVIAAYFYASSNYQTSSRRLSAGNSAAIISLIFLMLVGSYGIYQTNMRFIHADMVYKRGKPFDQQAGRQRESTAWDIAIAIYEEAIEISPEEDFYYLFLGRAYLERATITEELSEQANILSKAEGRLLEAQEINPLNTDHTANLARLNTRWTQLAQTDQERNGRIDGAEGYYQAALQLSPQNSIIRNEYARLLLDLRQECETALGVYAESIEVDPFFEQTFFALADAHITCATRVAADDEESQGEYYTNAAESLEAGLVLNDRNAQVWLRLAQIYQEIDEYTKAIESYEEVKAKDRQERFPDWNIDYLIAQTYQQMDETETAIEVAELALAAAPDEAKGQVQQLLNQLQGIETPIETTTTPEVDLAQLAAERPLATLDPSERNGFYNTYPPMVIDTSKRYEATVVTDRGEMRFRLFDNKTPRTVNNFAYLASQGFYDDVIFHRVLEDFMAQTGDPTGTGTGGPGYQFEDEIDPGIVFNKRGLLAMANLGPDTNGSQFFITFEPTPWLDGIHTIFGELIEGDDVLSSLTLRDPNDPTAPADRIIRVDIVEVTS